MYSLAKSIVHNIITTASCKVSSYILCCFIEVKDSTDNSIQYSFFSGLETVEACFSVARGIQFVKGATSNTH